MRARRWAAWDEAGNGRGGKAGWTELFFLDEVTALSAGHRPCFSCRRERAKDFVRRFGVAFGIAEPQAPEIDARLHRERLASGGRRTGIDPQASLPSCRTARWSATAVAYAIRDGKALRWTFAGYGDRWAASIEFGGLADLCIAHAAHDRCGAGGRLPAGLASDAPRP